MAFFSLKSSVKIITPDVSKSNRPTGPKLGTPVIDTVVSSRATKTTAALSINTKCGWWCVKQVLPYWRCLVNGQLWALRGIGTDKTVCSAHHTEGSAGLVLDITPARVHKYTIMVQLKYKRP